MTNHLQMYMKLFYFHISLFSILFSDYLYASSLLNNRDYNRSKLRLMNLLKASPFNNPLDNNAKSTI